MFCLANWLITRWDILYTLWTTSTCECKSFCCKLHKQAAVDSSHSSYGTFMSQRLTESTSGLSQPIVECTKKNFNRPSLENGTEKAQQALLTLSGLNIKARTATAEVCSVVLWRKLAHTHTHTLQTEIRQSSCCYRMRIVRLCIHITPYTIPSRSNDTTATAFARYQLIVWDKTVGTGDTDSTGRL